MRGMINSVAHLVRIVDAPARRRRPEGTTSDAAQRDQRQATARARTACASAAASAPASARQGGRGGKGQTARTGVAIGGFEGGQMPLHRRLPKRGFNKWRRKDFNEINIGALQQAIDDKRSTPASRLTSTALVAAGILRRAQGRPAAARRRRDQGQARADRQPRLGLGQGGDREGRRLDQADREEGARGRRGQAQEDRGQEGEARPRSRPAEASRAGRGVGLRARRWSRG